MSRNIALIVMVVLSVAFYAFRSRNYIGDGLRHLPVLRTIDEGAQSFKPKPWLEAYRTQYDRLVIRNHFLFALAARSAFGLQRALGSREDAILGIQVMNAIAGGIAGGFFFLLVHRLGVSRLISLAATVGVCLSPFYLLAATNIVEVAISLPFFLGTLLALANGADENLSIVKAGVAAGLAAIAYLLAGSVVPCVAASLIGCRAVSREGIKRAALFLSVFGIVFLGIWIVILYLSGIHDPLDLARSVLRSPQQGTYGGFKLGSLIAAPIGMTQGFFPILPDDFRGLRLLYQQAPQLVWVGAIVSMMTFALFVRAIYLLVRRRGSRSLPLFVSLLTFALVEGVCVEFDPYYPKLQTFAIVLFWVILSVTFADKTLSRTHRLLLIAFIAAVSVSGLRSLWINMRPSQADSNARELHASVGRGLLITGWSGDVANLWVYSNAENVVALPDFAFDRGLDARRVETDLEALIERSMTEGVGVYFYGLFETDDADLKKVYEERFRLNGFVSFVRALQARARPIGRFPRAGGGASVLYVYSP